MKVSKYQFNASVKKVGDSVLLDLNEESRKFVSSEELDISNNEVPSVAKQLQDDNEKNRSIARACLGSSEEQREVTLILKYLEE